MGQEIVIHQPGAVSLAEAVPPVIVGAGEQATIRFLEFFTANIRNKNTRRAHYRASAGVLAWCQVQKMESVQQVRPIPLRPISNFTIK